MKLLQWLFALSLSLILPSTGQAQAVTLDCPAEQQVSEALENGARWDFCRETRVRENLVLTDVHFTPVDGEPIRILASASLGQLHVAYDDSDVTYNDITQYGLGGAYLQVLSEADCSYGQRLYNQTRAVACLWTGHDSEAERAESGGSHLNLYSVSQVGAYTYVISWRFHDDGSIEPSIGATGALQRSGDLEELPFGRILSGDGETVWLSHTHNYYWRLDFDIGDSATDDVVTEIDYAFQDDGQRTTQITRFDQEQSRAIAPALQRGWSIHASSDQGALSQQRWHIAPWRQGQRFVRTEVEPYTGYDFFVTRADDCERFASQNARFNPDCLDHVLEYANGESIRGEDIVLWYRVSFHHVPRNEDQRNMHTHWDGFRIQALGIDTPPAEANAADALPPLELSPRTDRVSTAIDIRLNMNTTTSQPLTWLADNLPPDIELDRHGRLHGTLTESGFWSVALRVSNGSEVVNGNFSWQVTSKAGEQVTPGSGQLSLGILALLLIQLGTRFTTQKFSGKASRLPSASAR